MTFESFVKERCAESPEFKCEWDKLHEISSIGEALAMLEKLDVKVWGNELPTDVDTLLNNKGIKANSVIPNTILFYEASNKCPVAEFIRGIQNGKLQAKITKDIELLAVEGHHLTQPKVKYVADGIYELRTHQSTNITRIFYFFAIGANIILTNGYIKKRQKLDDEAFEKAKKYRDEYSKRINKGE